MIDTEAIRSSLLPLSLSDGELRDLSRALESPPRPAVRVRPGVDLDSLPFPVERTAWHPNGYFVQGDTRPASCIRFATGDYYIQDAASLLAMTALDAQSGERICDLCAAPGGKATAIVESVGDEGWLLANETIGSRVSALCLNLARQGATQFAVCQRDPETLATILGTVFDAVLVDAPCSGQSLVSRGRQTESAFGARAVEYCAARQTRILAAAARLVRPRGRLVYSTCTFSHAENEGQVEAFLASHPEFCLVPCQTLQPWESEVLPGSYRLWPHRHGCGGSFSAALVRREAMVGPANRRGRKPRAILKPSQIPDEISMWGRLVFESVRATSDRCFGWARSLWPLLGAVCHAGPEVAFRKGRTWFPSYALAMRRDPNWTPNATAKLSDQEAADYLRGFPIPCGQVGWAVATWKNRPLGWLKGNGRTAKNHLLKAARLSISGTE
ncbi:MAG: SAM-dependent methyltransferase [Pirellulaceae bacterium]